MQIRSNKEQERARKADHTAKEYTSVFSSSASLFTFGRKLLQNTSGAAYLVEIPKMLRKFWDLMS